MGQTTKREPVGIFMKTAQKEYKRLKRRLTYRVNRLKGTTERLKFDPYNFPAIRTGRDTEYLVAEVNSLRRKLFQAKQTVESYRRAAGFR